MKKKQSIQLLNSIRFLIIKKNLLQPNQSLVLAISGGQDSVFLLVVFFIIKKQWNIQLKVLYCNHLWQKDSFYLYLHLSKLLFSFKIELYFFITFKVLPSEEKSRYWRSKNYYRLLIFTKSLKILTGHTMTDQIETYLFNLIRGSSFKGTSSLKLERKFTNLDQNNFFSSNFHFFYFKILKNNIPLLKNEKYPISNKLEHKIFLFSKKEFLILNKNSLNFLVLRPLITKTRFQITNISNNWKLPVFPDQTNEKTNYSRNRLRKQILPTLRFFFNPKIDFILSRYNEILNTEENYIENIIFLLFESIITEDNNAYFINISLFYSLSLCFQRRICFLFFKEKMVINLKFSTINHFLKLINEYSLQIKKEKKFKQKMFCLFFPELGAIYLTHTFFIIFK
jgi:tRNA(Ile)-lysidine synthase